MFQKISEVTEVLSLPKPSLAILTLTINKFPVCYRVIVTHIFLASHLVITRHWKQDLTPNLSEVIELVQTHYTYEKMLDSHRDKTDDLIIFGSRGQIGFILTESTDFFFSFYSLLSMIVRFLFTTFLV